MPLVLQTKLEFDTTDAQVQVQKLKQQVKGIGTTGDAFGGATVGAKKLGTATKSLSKDMTGLSTSVKTVGAGFGLMASTSAQSFAAVGAMSSGMGALSTSSTVAATSLLSFNKDNAVVGREARYVADMLFREARALDAVKGKIPLSTGTPGALGLVPAGQGGGGGGTGKIVSGNDKITKSAKGASSALLGVSAAAAVGASSLAAFGVESNTVVSGVLAMSSAMVALSAGLTPISAVMLGAIAIFTIYSVIAQKAAAETEKFKKKLELLTAPAVKLEKTLSNLRKEIRAISAGMSLEAFIDVEDLERANIRLEGTASRINRLTDAAIAQRKEIERLKLVSGGAGFIERDAIQNLAFEQLQKAKSALKSIQEDQKNFNLTRVIVIKEIELLERTIATKKHKQDLLDIKELKSAQFDAIRDAADFRQSIRESGASTLLSLQAGATRSGISLIEDEFERRKQLIELSKREQLIALQDDASNQRITMDQLAAARIAIAQSTADQLTQLDRDRAAKSDSDDQTSHDNRLRMNRDLLNIQLRDLEILGDARTQRIDDRFDRDLLRLQKSRLLQSKDSIAPGTRVKLSLASESAVTASALANIEDELTAINALEIDAAEKARMIKELENDRLILRRELVQLGKESTLAIEILELEKVRRLYSEIVSIRTGFAVQSARAGIGGQFGTAAGLKDTLNELKTVNQSLQSQQAGLGTGTEDQARKAQIQDLIDSNNRQIAAMTQLNMAWITEMPAIQAVNLQGLINDMSQAVDKGLGDAVFAALSGESDQVREIFRNMFLDIAEDGTKAMLDAFANLFLAANTPGAQGGVGGLASSLISTGVNALLGGGSTPTDAAAQGAVSITNVNVQEDGAKSVIQAVNKRPNEIVNVIDSKRNNFRSTTRTL